MSRPANSHDAMTPKNSGVEFARSADDFPVARIGDITLAMLSLVDGGGFLASAWCVSRPLAEMTRADFFGHEGRLDDEAAFRDRVFETAEHRRELAAFARVETRIACSTPWGASQMATVYAEGITSHMTAGHGGFHLSMERNLRIHPSLRKETPWYEEDAEWAIVALTFPDLFTTYERRVAGDAIRNSWPDAWETIHGCVLDPGQSWEKARRLFDDAHAGDWVVISAILSDPRPGMTEVIATLGGKRDHSAEERRYLVPSPEYVTRSPLGFVIDPDRHQLYDGRSSFVGWDARRMVG
ncbi:hypothetical protein ASC75_19485 [Aminobacter sp. DSM 101952]|uniref:DUF7007 domain-containing protein n=3 Tax=Alphaproteobacteria TaxID=28211 RepID=A0A512HP93_9HYPH|nr:MULTISPECIES: hypothetical protein [Alphaproteobacteria]KQU75061.1 hypothetical protein ASC75_19485 [Aminobacter sp. DSM 101952]MBE0562572.1 hypothetical protein [Brucella anthropi]MBP8936908.1 hypothetical protein [Agrobacterium sp.]MCD4663259.1 hypothetical protein [Agrobacterium sp.]GEO87261.1 hypothetical protein RNA01_41930 [Ciceribacter naphthalenivorans]